MQFKTVAKVCAGVVLTAAALALGKIAYDVSIDPTLQTLREKHEQTQKELDSGLAAEKRALRQKMDRTLAEREQSISNAWSGKFLTLSNDLTAKIQTLEQERDERAAISAGAIGSLTATNGAPGLTPLERDLYAELYMKSGTEMMQQPTNLIYDLPLGNVRVVCREQQVAAATKEGITSEILLERLNPTNSGIYSLHLFGSTATNLSQRLEHAMPKRALYFGNDAKATLVDYVGANVTVFDKGRQTYRAEGVQVMPPYAAMASNLMADFRAIHKAGTAVKLEKE